MLVNRSLKDFKKVMQFCIEISNNNSHSMFTPKSVLKRIPKGVQYRRNSWFLKLRQVCKSLENKQHFSTITEDKGSCEESADTELNVSQQLESQPQEKNT